MKIRQVSPELSPYSGSIGSDDPRGFELSACVVQNC